MRNLRVIFSVIFTLLAILSCSDNSDSFKRTITLRPVPERIKIELTEAEQQQVQVNNSFAFELSNEVFKQNQGSNFLISPLSATFVLAMLENGSANQTQQQILNALHFDDETSMNTLCSKLISGAPKIDTSVEISIANGLFMDDEFPVKDEYVKSIEDIFDAEVKNIDFSNKQSAMKEINNWASNKTKGKISQILNLDEMHDNLKLAALNSIYFKGIWENEFDSKKTSKETFTHADGTEEKIDMMQMNDHFLYNSFDNFDMLHMAYGNDGYSMEVLLPKEGVSVEEVLNGLKKLDWKMTMMEMYPYKVDIKLPRFSTDYTTDMQPVLNALGITDMFTFGDADFSRISDGKIFMDLFKQKCTIDVNEKGTEATTTTISMDGPTHSAVLDAEFHANRPFIYMITENTTGGIYFIGTFN